MAQLSLIEDVSIPYATPRTEGIKYAGSKLKVIPHILKLAHRVPFKTVFDGFSGTTRVSQAFAQLGFRVISNDISAWSHTFARCYLKNTKNVSYFKPFINHLNALPGKKGWFTEHYGGNPNNGNSAQADGLKRPWQTHNTQKLDAIREEIDRLNLPLDEKCVLLSSLILALDEVDSTLGHFASYLREWSPRSFNSLKLKVPHIFNASDQHEVLQEDTLSLIENIECDLAYFDPPYGSSNDKMPPSRVRYAAYYHLWTTVCLSDEPTIFGKAKRRLDTTDDIAASVFEEYRKSESGKFMVIEAIETLLRNCKAKFIILSYSSGGRATAMELFEVIDSVGHLVDCVRVDYRQNVMSTMRWTNEWIRDAVEPHHEYLFLIAK